MAGAYNKNDRTDVENENEYEQQRLMHTSLRFIAGGFSSKIFFFSFFLFSFFRCSDNLLLLLLRSHMCDAIPFNIFSFVLFHFGCLILAGNINIFFFRSLPCSFILHFILWIFFFLFGQAAVVVFRVVE